MAPRDQLNGMPDNVNEAWFDAIVRHQIGLLRVSGRIRKEMLEILDATERDIQQQIKRRLAKGSTPARERALLKAIRAIRNDAWTKSIKLWREQIIEAAQAEPHFLAQQLRTVSPVQLDLVIPAAATLRSAALTRPFEGMILREWARNIRRADLRRIEQEIRIGITQGESAAAISRRVVGTARLRGRNGVTEITRRNADALARTAINAVSNQAKREFFQANSDIFDEELYVATLDSRTTPICRSLDGERFPVGEGPIPPLHFACRSLRLAIIDGEVLGSRPQRQFTQNQLLDEYSRGAGIRKPSSRAGLPRGHKGAFDQFAQERIRQLTGTIDAKVSYQEWLTRQSATFQDDVLGRTRGKLFREGNLPLDKFVSRNGDEINLSELATREADAFRAAGLDPDNFR